MEKTTRADKARPDPDALLREIEHQERGDKGRLKLFLGYAPGVGKTYAMLQQAHLLKDRGEDVVVGIVETHRRSDTEILLDGLEVVPLRSVPYEGFAMQEFDPDAVLARKPTVVLVDEMAHTNAPGSRHPKRYQDVEELLEAGIDVYTAVNIQHFESQFDTVASITGVSVQETVPDTMLEEADEVQVIDIPFEELTQRLKEGKVYIPEQARKAMASFFQRGNLVALRELTLSVAARKMGTELLNYMRSKAIAGTWAAGERVMVGISPGPYAPQLLRKAYSIAKDANAVWYAVYIASPSKKELSNTERHSLAEALNLAEELGAKTATITGSDIAGELIRFARDNNITRVVLGKPLGSRLGQLFGRSPVFRLLKVETEFELHLVTPVKEKESRQFKTPKTLSISLTPYALSLAMVAVITILNLVLQGLVHPIALVYIYLIATIGAALRFGTSVSLFASLVSLLTFDFFFIEPRYSFTMYHPHDVVNVVVFLFTSLVVGQLVKITRQQEYALQLRLKRVGVIEDMSKELLALTPVEQLIGGFTTQVEEWKHVLPVLRTTVLDDMSHIIVKYVAKIVDAPSSVLFPAQNGKLMVWAKTGPDADVDPHELAVAEWAYSRGELAGAGTQTLADASTCFLPMKSGDEVVGLVGIKYVYKDLLADERRLLGAVTSLAALGTLRWVKV